MTAPDITNLDPQHFVFWQPPAGHVVHVGSGQQPVPLPQIPLPLKTRSDGDGAPGTNAIGEGIYDYLRQFPDCPHNNEYVALLSQAYSHFLADLAAQVVMLDAKDVEPAYVFRKLAYLKILRLLEPGNTGLLWQLSHGFFNLAMTFNELPAVRRHLLEAMRFGQDLLKINPGDLAAHNLLAEIDILFGDYPGATAKLQLMLESVSDKLIAARIERRLETCLARGIPDHPLVDDLECIGDALQLYAVKEYRMATELLERLEQDDYFLSELKSADFFCLLGLCRIETGDPGGAFDALSQALEMEPDHEQAREALSSL
jgi:tetratricopeptide (TPR) repeat protein